MKAEEKQNTDHRARESASAASGHPNKKGDPWIIARLWEAFRYQHELPAFARGQIYYDFELGKVCVAPSKRQQIT